QRMKPLVLDRVKPNEETFIDHFRRQHADPAERAGLEAEIMLRKNWSALGSFVKEDLSRAPDLLGFRSRLVFNPFLSAYLCTVEREADVEFAYGLARAHNRAMVDFCSVDRRLLAVGYVPLAEFARTRAMAEEAVAMGCKALLVPAACPETHSPSHTGPFPRRAVAPEGGPAGGVPRRGRRQGARPALLRQRPATGAGLPGGARDFPLGELHGAPPPADADARHHDHRRDLRPLPASQGRCHRAGRGVGSQLDAPARRGTRGIREERGAAARAHAQAERVRSAPDPNHAVPDRARGMDHPEHRPGGLPVLLGLAARRGRSQPD